MSPNKIALCIDIGGTFTDVILIGHANVTARKVLSTSLGYAEAVLSGTKLVLEDSGVSAEMIGAVVHGTTVATNTVLEGTGPNTTLLTTKGCRDVLELRRMRCPDPYDLNWSKPPPLVPRRRRLEVDERLSADGEIIEPLTAEAIAKVLDAVQEDTDVAALAICLLNSYRNPTHEVALERAIEERGLSATVSRSSEVWPEIGEYERTSTTVVDAYVKPVIVSYLDELVKGMHALGIHSPIYVMQSDGTCCSVESARSRPFRILESGPAAGVVAASRIATENKMVSAIAFDVGGTTSKASLIRDGQPLLAPYLEVGAPVTSAGRAMKGGGYVVQGSAVDVAEIGTGGGSQLWVDAGGRLAVGPRSSGSMPGPVCYGLGGSVPTLTDAAMVLGYVNPAGLAGGGLKVDRNMAIAALAPLVPVGGDSPESVAANALTIANASMARAIRSISVDRGVAPRECVLVAYGGGGPVHAAHLAQLLELEKVIIPPFAGLLSAAGMSASGVGLEFATSIWRSATTLEPRELRELREELQSRATAELREQGWSAREIAFTCRAELHYRGQLAQLPIELPMVKGSTGPGGMDLAGLFHDEHERQYGYCQRDAEVQIGNLRLNAQIDLGIDGEGHRQAPAEHAREALGTRTCYFGMPPKPYEVPVVDRAEVANEWEHGPVVIDESDTSIVVPPDCFVRCDDIGNIAIRLPRTA